MDTARFTYTAGGLIARQVRRAIAEYAWEKGLDIRFEEEGGWLQKSVRVTLTGRGAEQAKLVLLAWIACV